MIRGSIALLLAVILYPSIVHSQEKRFFLDATVGVYSDMCIHPESGDAHGVRAVVLDMQNELFIVFQEAESWPAFPVVSEVRIAGNKIEFDVFTSETLDGSTRADRKRAQPTLRTTFKGEITQDAITGVFADGTDYYHKHGKDGRSYGDDKTFILKRERGEQAGDLDECS